MTRIWLKQNVLDAAVDRMRRIYDEFPTVIVSFSGGKDSTVCLQLALKVAREKKRLPVPVFWIDQEAEWQSVVDYVRPVMNSPEVRPLWFQAPFKIFNATTSSNDPWLHCWEEGGNWIRPKEPNSIHVNETGTDRFKELFGAFVKRYFGSKPSACIGGVRCEESPGRMLGLTSTPKYKDITWGNIQNSKIHQYTFYPIYDWTYADVWKFIHDNNFPYCRLYDYMYQYGTPVREMRVSNVHHETALKSLHFLQDIEPETWNRIVERLGSVNAVARSKECYSCPKELPRMFKDWREYRQHLLENLVQENKRYLFERFFVRMDNAMCVENPVVDAAVCKAGVSAILVNDFEGTIISNFMVAQKPPGWLRWEHRGHSIPKATQEAQTELWTKDWQIKFEK